MTKVALSGASGNIGQVLRPALLERGIDLRSAGVPDGSVMRIPEGLPPLASPCRS